MTKLVVGCDGLLYTNAPYDLQWSSKKLSMKINFVNHASFSIHSGSVHLLIDPWFSGQVFNNSWGLLDEVPIPDEMLVDVSHVGISHEHPDHFHIPTLKRIASVAKTKPTLIFPWRMNPAFQKVAEDLGFHFCLAQRDGLPVELSDDFKVSWYGEVPGDNNTIIINCGNKIIVNQNDHYTGDDTIRKIKEAFPRIDMFLTQFSLAGYYGNRDDPNTIKSRGTQYHIDRVKKYCEEFSPICLVPIASYVYFCDPYNQYLNDYIVTPRRIFEEMVALGQNVQLVMPKDEFISIRNLF